MQASVGEFLKPRVVKVTPTTAKQAKVVKKGSTVLVLRREDGTPRWAMANDGDDRTTARAKPASFMTRPPEGPLVYTEPRRRE